MLKLELRTFSTLDYTKPLSIWDVSDYLIDKSISCDFRFEYTKIFDYIVSSLKFQLIPEANVKTNVGGILDLTAYDGTNGMILTCRVVNDNYPDFLGVLDPLNSEFNRESQTYTLTFNDIFKYIYTQLSQHSLFFPGILGQGDNLNSFLQTYSFFSLNYPTTTLPDPFDPVLPPTIPPVQVFVGVGDSVTTFQNSSDPSGTGPTKAVNYYIGKMAHNDFLFEMQKYYNAYVYTDGNGNIYFLNKNASINYIIPYLSYLTKLNISQIDPNIDADVFEESDTTQFSAPPQYSSLLINIAAHSYANNPEDVYALIYTIAGQLTMGEIDGNLDGLGSLSYYDARFNFIGQSTEYRIFASRNQTQLFNTYRDIIVPQSIMRCKVNRTDLIPMMKVSRFGQNYNIVSIKKYYDQNYSELELLPLVN